MAELILGPYHPWLREPLMLRLDLHGETVRGAELEPGFNRRGIERLLEAATWEGALALAGRLCEGCAVANTLAFCEAVERVAGLLVPLRGQYLRLVLAELERARSHLLASAALLDAVGLPGPAARQFRRAAGRLSEVQAAWLGSRTLPLTYGGLVATADILSEERAEMTLLLAEVEQAVAPHVQGVLRHGALARRLVGLAGVRPITAERLDLRGPVGRAADLDRDLRRDAPSAAYARLQTTAADAPADVAEATPAPVGSTRVTVVTQRGGDAYARLTVRLLESLESLRLVRLALDSLPGGPVGLAGATRAEELVAGALAGRDEGRIEALGRAEGPRGEVTCVVAASPEGPLLVHFHTGSFAILPAVGPALAGCALTDLPAAYASFDLCLACAER